MKKIKILISIKSILRSVYGSADPNLFGSRKRIKEKQGLANEFKSMSDSTQKDIDSLKTANPFESATAKSAMKKASMNAKWQQNKIFNVLGANATPEAIIAAQGQTAQALGSAAGNIAAGSEANKNYQVNALYGLQQNQMANYANSKTDSINERGSGWKDFFNNLDAFGKIAQAGGQAAGALTAGEGTSAALAALSDTNNKENIHYIGELQGKRIYKFNFIGNPVVHIGVLAQEVEEKEPENVIEVNGEKKVFYDKIFSEVTN